MKPILHTTLHLAVLSGLALTASAGTVTITDVYAHNEKTNYNLAVDEMIIGSGMNDVNHPDEQTSWPPATDPSTWMATGSGYQDEWQSGDLLGDGDEGEDLPTNDKIGWAAFDLDSAIADLDKLYLWNIREATAQGRRVVTYNVYHAETPTVPLTHGPTGGTSIDYDFSSGGWTKLNTGGPLTITQRGASPDPANAVIDLGGVTARYVAIEILSNAGDTGRTGFAEVGITTSGGSGTPAPKITSVTKSGSTVTVEFEGTDGETYDLNKSTTLDFSSLNSVDDVTLSGTTGTLQDTGATEDEAYYRVEQR